MLFPFFLIAVYLPSIYEKDNRVINVDNKKIIFLQQQTLSKKSTHFYLYSKKNRPEGLLKVDKG